MRHEKTFILFYFLSFDDDDDDHVWILDEGFVISVRGKEKSQGNKVKDLYVL